LKQRAKLITGDLGKNPYLSFGREDTFVTGGGLPGRNRRTANVQADQEEEDDEDKDYDCLEDQLLAEVDKHEKDFNQMFAYLNEVENMLHGDDVAQIRELIKVTDRRSQGHMLNYDKIRADMAELTDDAVEAMNSLGKFDQKAAKIAKDAERQADNFKKALAIITEEPADSKPKEKAQMGLAMGGKNASAIVNNQPL